MVIPTIQGFVSNAEFPALDTGLDVLYLVDVSLHFGLALMELCRVLTNERAEPKSKEVNVCRLEERRRAVRMIQNLLAWCMSASTSSWLSVRRWQQSLSTQRRSVTLLLLVCEIWTLLQ